MSNAPLSKPCSVEFLVHVLDFSLHIFVFMLCGIHLFSFVYIFRPISLAYSSIS